MKAGQRRRAEVGRGFSGSDAMMRRTPRQIERRRRSCRKRCSKQPRRASQFHCCSRQYRHTPRPADCPRDGTPPVLNSVPFTASPRTTAGRAITASPPRFRRHDAARHAGCDMKRRRRLAIALAIPPPPPDSVSVHTRAFSRPPSSPQQSSRAPYVAWR